MYTRRARQHLTTVAAPLAGLVVLMGAPAFAQERTFELKLSHWMPPTIPLEKAPATHPLQKAMIEWGKSVELASNWTIKFKVFPSQQLGRAAAHYNMARDGIADLTFVNSNYDPGRFPILAATELPFLIGDAKGGTRAVDEWYRKYERTEMQDVKYCFSFILEPLTWHSKTKRIALPSDIKGLKVRTSQATMAAWVARLGGINMQARATDLRYAMEQEAVDAVTFPWRSLLVLGIDKVTKYHMVAPLHTVTFQWLMSPRTYAAMSRAQKKVIDEHCTTEKAGEFADRWADFERAGLAQLKALKDPKGLAIHEVYELTNEQLREWRNSAKPLMTQWEESVRKAGEDPDIVMNELKQALKKYGSAFRPED
jgi:TRAP-type C4-dicarboxylate transport system substrate-binding protein